MNVIDSIVTRAAGLTDLRRHLHAHPELSFEERTTADLIARKLDEWGIPYERGLAGTGVVGIVKGGTSSRAIGLRADIDALPIQELNTFAHASKHAGKMHACGHDGHTAMLLAAAQYFAEVRNFDGTAYLIFQPGEEFGGGARVMINDGLFEKFPMDAVYSMHNWPGTPVGKFHISAGPVMASSNEFKITIRGKGSHAAMPHLGIDPVPVACQVVQGFQTIISRNMRPLDAAVISVTMIHAGQATNVVADTCELRGTVRTFSLDVLNLIERAMRRVAENTCEAFDATCEFDFTRNYPPTLNHPAESALVARVLGDIVGNDNVLPQEPTMGSEDFAYMLQAKPGAYCFIGNGDGTHRDAGHGGGPCMCHNASYDFNDELIPLGATFWVRLVETCLPKERQ
jgi:hippurate hydrolase